MEKARNDLSAAVPKFCLALEEHRRTPEGRVRTSQEMLATFFPHDEKSCTDASSSTCRTTCAAPSSRPGASAASRRRSATPTTRSRASCTTRSSPATSITRRSRTASSPETLVRWVAARRPLGVLARRQADEAGDPQGPVDGVRALPLRRALVPRHGPGQGRRAQGDGRPRRRSDEGRADGVDPPHPRDGRRHAEGPRRRARLGQDRGEGRERGARRRARRDRRRRWARRRQPRSSRNCSRLESRPTQRRQLAVGDKPCDERHVVDAAANARAPA